MRGVLTASEPSCRASARLAARCAECRCTSATEPATSASTSTLTAPTSRPRRRRFWRLCRSSSAWLAVRLAVMNWHSAPYDSLAGARPGKAEQYYPSNALLVVGEAVVDLVGEAGNGFVYAAGCGVRRPPHDAPFTVPPQLHERGRQQRQCTRFADH